MQNLSKTLFSWYFFKIVIIRKLKKRACKGYQRFPWKNKRKKIGKQLINHELQLQSFVLVCKTVCVQFSFDTFLSDCVEFILNTQEVQIYLVGSRDEQVEELCSCGRWNIWDEGGWTVNIWPLNDTRWKEILAGLCACNTLWLIQYSAYLLHFMSS